jgi:hypothetical protein
MYNITTKEIELWLDNDEGLYNWFRGSRLSKREFIKQHRNELKECISRVVSGEKPAHFLAYRG